MNLNRLAFVCVPAGLGFPIYTWVIKGGDKRILVDTGGMNPIQSKDREEAIGGKIHTFEQDLKNTVYPHPILMW